jgi:hypothetical protein
MKTINRILDAIFPIIEIGLCLTLAVVFSIQSFSFSLMMLIPAGACLIAGVLLTIKRVTLK